MIYFTKHDGNHCFNTYYFLTFSLLKRRDMKILRVKLGKPFKIICDTGIDCPERCIEKILSIHITGISIPKERDKLATYDVKVKEHWNEKD